MGAGGRPGLQWVFGVALVVALAAAVWQGLAASAARDEVADLEGRVAALKQEVADRRDQNAALRVENMELREGSRGSVAGLLAPLLRGETPTEEDILEFLLPYLEERIGNELGELGDRLVSGLDGFRDEFERGLGELFGDG